MKARLTLNINGNVIDAAKAYARRKGASLSVIVENYLRSITTTEDATDTLSPKVAKLMGVINLPEDFEYKKDLSKALAKKY